MTVRTYKPNQTKSHEDSTGLPPPVATYIGAVLALMFFATMWFASPVGGPNPQ